MIDPYQIICPHCRQAFSPETGESDTLPTVCPFCHEPLGEDYEIRYEKSTKTKPFRVVAMIILVVFFLLILLAIMSLLLSH
jgi:nitrite reductase/ring-hydroxylating ferredoxin subunit